jgi:hypothetical protein
MKGTAGVPLIAFAADGPPPYLDHWRAILARQRVPFILDAAVQVDQRERAGERLRFDGAHWNRAGHALVGRVLAERAAGYLPAR